MSPIDPQSLTVLSCQPHSLGAWVREGGARFAILSRHATRVWLALFDRADDTKPAAEIEFDPVLHHTGDIWCMLVMGVKPGTLYAYRMDGPFDPSSGYRYDKNVYLLDPYAKIVTGDIPRQRGKCVLVEEDREWNGDKRPRIAGGGTVIYETHVRGLTVHESSGVAHPGTYLGLIEKIPYLKSLGVTAVELLPIQELGEDGLGRCSLVTGEELRNYWGYNSIAFFAPAGRYATNAAAGTQLHEFREMVHALHEAGLEVIMDVVFNHTAEGNELGQTLSFRGIDNVLYYLLDKDGRYRNFSGCGNTMNCNHPVVRNFIMDCLRYWVIAMHVDGFRFDLASILGRDRKGNVVENAPLIEQIAEDPILRDVKLIAEAWDAGGAYQVGSFGDIRWAEWNGRYRDDVRRFWRGDLDMKGAFATRLAGSADLYQDAGRTPLHSINFITAHDGFTLRDLVSYNEKHNESNGENNTDGLDENFSWNCGVEGLSNDPKIEALRLRMQKNFLATLFLSLGIPMMLGGDEFGRGQSGNNNAYCQDNEISWHDWMLLDRNWSLFDFCREAIRFRKENPVFSRDEYFTGQPASGASQPDLAWFNAAGERQTWDAQDPTLACRFDGSVNRGVTLYLAFNPSGEAVVFQLPEAAWTVRMDTAKDVSAKGARLRDRTYRVESHAMAVFSNGKL